MAKQDPIYFVALLSQPSVHFHILVHIFLQKTIRVYQISFVVLLVDSDRIRAV